MSIRLVNCNVCGHVVATDARTCPQCGTNAFLSDEQKKILSEEQEAAALREYEQRIKEGKDLCVRIRERIKQKGKLFHGGIVKNYEKASGSLAVNNFYERRSYHYLIDGKEFFTRREHSWYGYEDISRTNYLLLPYGKHEVSVCIVPDGKSFYAKKYSEYKTYTKSFIITPDDNDIIYAPVIIEYKRPILFGDSWRDSVREIDIRESKIDFAGIIKKAHESITYDDIEEIYFWGRLAEEPTIPPETDFKKLFFKM